MRVGVALVLGGAGAAAGLFAALAEHPVASAKRRSVRTAVFIMGNRVPRGALFQSTAR
jgi:hypothetical protein